MATPPWAVRIEALPEQGPVSISGDETFRAQLLIEQLERDLREAAVPEDQSLAIKFLKLRLAQGVRS